MRRILSNIPNGFLNPSQNRFEIEFDSRTQEILAEFDSNY
jgi:hypothetical protein